LVNFLKSVEPLLNQGRVFYIESRPCQPLIFSVFKLFQTRQKPSGLLLQTRRAFYTEPLPCQPLSEEILKPFSSALSSSYFLRSHRLSGLSLRSGAHSTALRETVNDQFSFIFPDFGFHLFDRLNTEQFDRKLY